jgi:hypothetical protein
MTPKNSEVDRPDNLNTGSRFRCRNLRSACKSAISLVATEFLTLSGFKTTVRLEDKAFPA